MAADNTCDDSFWQPAAVTTVQLGRMLEYVPMQGYTLDVDALPERTVGARPRPLRHLLTFNEPNHVDQVHTCGSAPKICTQQEGFSW